jgi:hypothetical protein
MGPGGRYYYSSSGFSSEQRSTSLVEVDALGLHRKRQTIASREGTAGFGALIGRAKRRQDFRDRQDSYCIIIIFNNNNVNMYDV